MYPQFPTELSPMNMKKRRKGKWQLDTNFNTIICDVQLYMKKGEVKETSSKNPRNNMSEHHL